MSQKYDLCKIEESDTKGKKYDATFREKGCPCAKSKPPECGKKEKTVSFGAKGMSDYTIHKDDKRKDNLKGVKPLTEKLFAEAFSRFENAKPETA